MPHDVTYFSFCFRVSCFIPIGDISRVRVFIMENDPFFNFCPFLTMSRWRRCNLTRVIHWVIWKFAKIWLLPGQITTTSPRHGQKRTKVEKRFVFPFRKSDRWNGSYLNDTMNTPKKNWNKWRHGINHKKTPLFYRIFGKSWKFLSKKHG